MKNLSLITWVTQLGLSVAMPPIGFILLAVWLRRSLNLGCWVLWAAVVLGIYCSIQGFCACLRTMKRLSQSDKEHKPVSFNDHS